MMDKGTGVPLSLAGGAVALVTFGFGLDDVLGDAEASGDGLDALVEGAVGVRGLVGFC